MARRFKKGNKSEYESAYLTRATWSHYYQLLSNLAKSTFLWEDLPDTIDPVFMEYVLYKYGMAVVFEEPDIGLVCLPALIHGRLDIYNRPISVTAISENGHFRRNLDRRRDDFVIIFNTNHDLSSKRFIDSLKIFCDRITNAERTEDINIYAQRTPITVVLPDDTMAETYLNFLDKYDKYGKVVITQKNFDPEAMKALQTAAPFVAGQINEVKTRQFNEALSFLGISNVAIQKKERMITDEVTRSMGGAIASRNIRQNPREESLKEMKRLWGDKYGFNDARVSFNENLNDSEFSGDIHEQTVYEEVVKE